MKYYKSFILFSLFALAFVSCNTDDLERDIDALKDRVTNVEAQVQQLNDEMNCWTATRLLPITLSMVILIP